jgi:hypothetical protein
VRPPQRPIDVKTLTHNLSVKLERRGRERGRERRGERKRVRGRYGWMDGSEGREALKRERGMEVKRIEIMERERKRKGL